MRLLNKADLGFQDSPNKRKELILSLDSKHQIQLALQEPKNPEPKPVFLSKAEK